MKTAILVTMILMSSVSMASGSFVFQPETNFTKNSNALKAGFSINEHLLGPISFKNWTGTGLDQETTGKSIEAKSFVFKNGIEFKVMEKLAVEVGHQYTKNYDDKSNDQVGFMKVSTVLWQ